jgi:hypothetical protein
VNQSDTALKAVDAALATLGKIHVSKNGP